MYHQGVRFGAIRTMASVELTPIHVEIVEEHVAVPRGLTPIYVHKIAGDRIIAHARDWSAETEYDQNLFDLYPLSEARSFVVQINSDTSGDQVKSDWYDSFGTATKEGLKSPTGEWAIRERVG